MAALPPIRSPSSSISLPSVIISSVDPFNTSLSDSPATSSSRPLPLLPTELKREILRFCDPSTLAKTSSLSVAFLQLSSPLLYDEINITGFEALAKLFCNRPSSLHQAQLEPYLSLTRIRSLTFAPPSTVTFPLPELSSSRIPSTASAVEVEPLALKLSQSANQRGDPYRSCWETFFLFLNPRSVHLIGVKLSPPTIDLRPAAWPNLTLLSFDGCIGVLVRDWPCLRGDGTDVSIVLVFALNSGASLLRNAYECTDKASRRVRSVVIRSSSHGLKAVAEKTFVEFWSWNRATGGDLERRKSLITYEVSE